MKFPFGAFFFLLFSEAKKVVSRERLSMFMHWNYPPTHSNSHDQDNEQFLVGNPLT